jgi:serine/threonine protein phosphatase 1
VHGRLDLLTRVHAAIDADLRAHPIASPVEITIGDLVDRGPASRGVVDAVARRAIERSHSVVALRGNHEDMVLRFLDDAREFEDWREFGGYETLMSYGVARRPVTTQADREDLRDAFIEALPPQHLRFFEDMAPYWIEGDYVFVHAGLRPGVPFPMQNLEELRWIRDDFLLHEAPFEYFVVHGHTPVTQILCRPNRIDIDTGAYATGNLSCLVLEADSRWSLETAGGTTRRRVLPG